MVVLATDFSASWFDDIDNAVDLLLDKRDARITVIGDFDVDGATSTALVLRCLQAYGFADVDYLVPNRFEFGYGLTPEIVAVAGARSPDSCERLWQFDTEPVGPSGDRRHDGRIKFYAVAQLCLAPAQPRLAGQAHARVDQCFLCHQTTAWPDIPRVGWYKHH